MTQNCPILPYKMLVNLKEIIVINLFYNLPYFFIQFISNSKFRVHTPYGLSKLKKKMQFMIKNSGRGRGSNPGLPAWQTDVLLSELLGQYI